MDRFPKSRAAKFEIQLRDDTGTLVDPDGGAAAIVPVTVRDGAAASVVTGNATRTSQGIYQFAVTPTHTATLDVLEATWTPTFGGVVNTIVTQAEVVGAFYFSIREARLFDNACMADTTTYPAADVADGRESVADALEDECAVAFVPRGRRVSLDGNACSDLWLPNVRLRRLVSVKVDGTAVADLTTIAVYPDGRIYRSSGWAAGRRNVVVHYEHGYDVPPERIKRAALMLLRERLVPSNVDDRTVSITNELGTQNFAVAGRGHGDFPFGIPEVDAAVQQYREVAYAG